MSLLSPLCLCSRTFSPIGGPDTLSLFPINICWTFPNVAKALGLSVFSEGIVGASYVLLWIALAARVHVDPVAGI